MFLKPSNPVRFSTLSINSKLFMTKSFFTQTLGSRSFHFQRFPKQNSFLKTLQIPYKKFIKKYLTDSDNAEKELLLEPPFQGRSIELYYYASVRKASAHTSSILTILILFLLGCLTGVILSGEKRKRKFEELKKSLQMNIAETIGLEMTVEKKEITPGGIEFEGIHIFRTDEYVKEHKCMKFDLYISKANFQTSLLHFILGKGLIKSLEIEGVKGFCDRRTSMWSEEELANYVKRTAKYGDFEFHNFSIKDVDIIVHHPYPDRPITFTIEKFETNMFRQNWFVYDVITAQAFQGTYDGSPYHLNHIATSNGSINRWKVSMLNYDNITSGYDSDHPMSWVSEGKMDIEFLYFSTMDIDDVDFTLSMNLHHLKAGIPQGQTLMNRTIYSMLAYYSEHTKIPINVSFSIPLATFNGALYPYDIQLFENCGNAIYKDFKESIVSQVVKVTSRYIWLSFRSFVLEW